MLKRDDVLRMAEEAGILFREFRAGDKKTILSDGSKTLEVFEAFAAAAYAAGQAAEREACANMAASTICDTHIPTGINIYGSRVAEAIRARK